MRGTVSKYLIHIAKHAVLSNWTDQALAYTGYVDGHSRGQIRGWAIDLQIPNSFVMVYFETAGGVRVGQVIADRYRADVHKQGFGDGYCGFAVPARHFDPLARIRFFCGHPPHELGRLSLRAARPRATHFRRGHFVLRLDRRPAAAGLTGWVLNRHDLQQRRRLLLCANGQILATQTATLFREDSLAEGGDGLHGFSLPPVETASPLTIVDASTGTAIGLN